MGAAAVGAAAAVASTAISAGSAIAGSGSASSAISGASAQAQALDNQTRETGAANYQNSLANLSPFISTGQGAATRSADLLGLNGTDAASAAMAGFQASPGYAYQVQQGLKAVDAGAASQGLLRSGATLRAEQTLGNNLANGDFGNYLSRLNSLAGLGLQGAQGYNTATSTYDNLLLGVGSSEANTITGAGTQQASIAGNQSKLLGDAASGLVKNGYTLAEKNGLFDAATKPALDGVYTGGSSGPLTTTAYGF